MIVFSLKLFVPFLNWLFSSKHGLHGIEFGLEAVTIAELEPAKVILTGIQYLHGAGPTVYERCGAWTLGEFARQTQAIVMAQHTEEGGVI